MLFHDLLYFMDNKANSFWKHSSTSIASGSKFSSNRGDGIGGVGGIVEIALKGSEIIGFKGDRCIELTRARGRPKSSLKVSARLD